MPGFHLAPVMQCGGHSGSGQHFCLHALVFSVSLSLYQCSIIIFILKLLPERQVDEAWECSNKALLLFLILESTVQKSYWISHKAEYSRCLCIAEA
jgi:hypothetical protein